MRAIKALEVAERLQVSKTTAYEIIRRLNAELEKSGHRTVKGRVNEHYFNQVYFETPLDKRGGRDVD